MTRNTADLAIPHINSFNHFLNVSIPRMARQFEPVSIRDKFENHLKISVDSIQIDKPLLVDGKTKKTTRSIPALPSLCRQTARTYRGEIRLNLVIDQNGMCSQKTVSIGTLPIMLGSDLCHLAGMSADMRIKAKEDPNDLGGYFICNGLEKLCRFIQTQKKYVPYGLFRPSLAKKIKNGTSHAVGFKSARLDGRVSIFVLHYLSDHSVRVKVRYGMREYYIPLTPILRALSGRTDKEIHRDLCAALNDDPDMVQYADLLIQSFAFHKSYTQNEALAYLGKWFKVLFEVTSHSILLDGPARTTTVEKRSIPTEPAEIQNLIKNHIYLENDIEYGERFLRETLAVHLEKNEDKYNLLILCLSKLFLQVAEKITPDNSDSVMMHEVITPGDIFTEIFADRLVIMRRNLMGYVLGNVIIRSRPITDTKLIDSLFKAAFFDISSVFNRLISTGILSIGNLANFASMQQAGFVIIAERLNFWRFFSHFRSVHRGAYFQEIRTTTVRKLLPESWGFLCPVHTPDGSPCGLLTHLSNQCEISYELKRMPVQDLVECGLVLSWGAYIKGVPVVQNGQVVGFVAEDEADNFVSLIRRKKVQNQKYIYLEVFYQNGPASQKSIFLINSPNRLMRPVHNYQENKTEYIGTTEQVFLQLQNLGGTPTPLATHQEIDKTNMLSLVAGSTPLGNLNPSPRNMYQCQMAKQSMGTPPYSQKYRTDQKTYEFEYPQIPLFHTNIYKNYQLKDYPIGKNIMIAIISYTGYDLEDAVILNKASVDRGFMRGSILKSESINLDKTKSLHLGTLQSEDGLPSIAQVIKDKDTIYTIRDEETFTEVPTKNKSMEEMRIDSVAVFNSEIGKRAALIKSRIPRIPTIGDKFSSRHGQKGVCSILYEDEDMPFSESGITPDLIINPHAFPSRMSIGMFIENMATKVGAMSGEFQDGSMFKYGESLKAHEYFGDLLEAHGYRRGGGETLYSGVTGKPLKVEIFFGIVYYQRLRHMVNDKFQVRTTGPIHNLTKQPIGGRKRAGGIRLGEMERDVLISHGASSLIQDRMMKCSDGTIMNICRECNTLCFFQVWKCTTCNSARNIVRTEFPYVFKYLLTELISMNLECRFTFQSKDTPLVLK
ncbi:DNA-directed RNA polymerase I subunit RPA2 [Nematocida homosporus]|uniref:DNA-directed RNA polymerase I subunit RPA2 n=1 Tax=Nematocida homosporus TaxID=1912981 RepID=UPI002220E18D|nr:DNA-directed RNA polymerase I subunit RPA2 [Nematocida homosporus]KAI5185708.1 DNA-directed RNA polymerase I subunit RPA2 [Nematocida homosporus]